VLARLQRLCERNEAAHARLVRATSARRVGLVRHAASMNRLAMDAIALVVVNLRHR
jgi:hypothetical protein